MDEKLHIVITGEQGETRAYAIGKRRLENFAGLGLTFLILLAAVGFLGLGLSVENVTLKNRLTLVQKDLDSTLALNAEYQEQLAVQEKEKEELLQHALSELNQRSKAIESILSTVGVDVEVQESQRHAGGPYTSYEGDSYQDLTVKVDQYLEAIQFIPLGAPVPGTITSKFGKRKDPINGRLAFHNGLDIRNHQGTKIMATADGTVSAKGYTRGYGNYVELDHGNDFRTKFLHLKKGLVEKGERVGRGQVIGQLGSTGRSTGPHLHYSIEYRKKAVNPIKFMRIAKYITLDGEK